MKRAKINITARNRTYDYGFYTRKSLSELMKINTAIISPDLFLDSLVNEDYVVDTSPEATGLSVPDVEKIFSNRGVTLSVKDDPGVRYYYGIVAYQYEQPISEMTYIPCTVQQPQETISHILHDISETPVDTFPKTVFLDYSKVAVPDVPKIEESNINYDLKDIIISNDVIINLPNVWYDVDKIYNYRPYQSLYLTAISGQGSSEPVQVFSDSEKAYIPIQKIEILKRDITSTPEDTTPDMPESTDTETIRLLVLKDGIYYDRDYEKLPVNMVSGSGLVSVFDRSGIQKTLSVKDRVQHEKTYRYTMRVFDILGQASEPSVLIIRT